MGVPIRRLLRASAAATALSLAAWVGTAAGQTAPAPRVVASAPATLPESLPLRRAEPASSQGTSWVPVLSLLFLLLVGAAVLVRRRGAVDLLRGWKRPGAAAPGVERLSSHPLTAQASVHAVRWHGEELLLGCTSQQVTVLARRPAAAGEERPS